MGLLALIAVLAGCTGPTPPVGAPNVLLIVVDTFRADRSSVYGGPRDSTPHLAALARQGTVYEGARSVAPWTLPAASTILTGQYPSTHGATHLAAVLSPEVTTLAERVRARGWRTDAVVSHVFMGPDHGLDQGFETIDASHAGGHATISTEAVTDLAIARMRARADEPSLLLVHYFDPHYEYLDHAHPDWAPAKAGRLTGERDIWKLRDMRNTLTEPELEFLRARYDEELHFTDRGIGRLLAEVERLGRSDDTLVVVTSDHGEEFMDHGWLGHTRSLYDELIQVPLVLRGPGIPAGQRLGVAVSVASITPTILDVLGVEAAGEPLPAPVLPLVPLAADVPRPWVFSEVNFEPPPPKPVLAKRAHLKAITDGVLKLVFDETSGGLALFDLSVDPGEQTDLATSRPEVVAALRPRLEAMWSEAARDKRVAPVRDLDDEERARLRSLGYIE